MLASWVSTIDCGFHIGAELKRRGLNQSGAVIAFPSPAQAVLSPAIVAKRIQKSKQAEYLLMLSCYVLHYSEPVIIRI